MNRSIEVLTFAGAIIAGTVAVLAQTAAPVPEHPTLTAANVESVEFEAELEGAWKEAEVVTTPTFHSKRSAGPEVELRAVHDGEYVYLMARWEDATKNDAKKEWSFSEKGWSKALADEDRFAVAINGNAAGFAEKGCTSLCHDGEMRTEGENQHADLWHWKAARGGLNAACDDQNIGGGEVGRGNDEGKGAYEDNVNEDGTAPKWTWAKDVEQGAAFTADTAVAISDDFKPEDGMKVPYYRLRDGTESRGDVTSAAKYADGWWTVVLKRKLDTGNKDDVALTVGTEHRIAIAVFDNTGAKTGKEHAKSPMVLLKLSE